MPEPDARDKFHSLVTKVVSPIPYASDLISAIVKRPFEKRLKAWHEALANDLVALEKKVEGFSIENLSQNEPFISSVFQLTQIAIRTHQLEKLKVLRNAVLNSALPTAPDDTLQMVFNSLLDALTPYHIKILMLFEQSQDIPEIDLDDSQWVMNIQVQKLGRIIEQTYPEMQGQFALYMKIIKDLRSYDLISTKFPASGMSTKLEYSPKPTKLAQDLLKYIKSPTDEE